VDQLGGVLVSKVDETTAVLELTGEHDLSTEDAIERLLLRLVAENDSVVIDVTNAEYLDSSLLGNLLRADELARAEGKRIFLQIGTASPARRSFDLTLILERLAHASSRRQALALAAATPPPAHADSDNGSFPRASTLALRLMEAFDARDWELLQTLYHPGAQLPTIAGDRQPLTPRQLLAVLRPATIDGVYQYEVDGFVDLDPRVCVGSGRVRHRLPPNGIADHTQHWLYVFKDGLLWRSGLFSTLQRAKQAFADQGYTLGLDLTSPSPVEPLERLGP
jgi:anti-anti-sigma factor